jgi:hypothetical protein
MFPRLCSHLVDRNASRRVFANMFLWRGRRARTNETHMNSVSDAMITTRYYGTTLTSHGGKKQALSKLIVHMILCVRSSGDGILWSTSLWLLQLPLLVFMVNIFCTLSHTYRYAAGTSCSYRGGCARVNLQREIVHRTFFIRTPNFHASARFFY